MQDNSIQLNAIWNDFPSVQSDLREVLDVIQTHINAKNAEVQDALIEMMTTGGKLLRPALTLLIGQLTTNNHDDLVHLAATVEMLHTATLVHDDIIDSSSTRRHHPSIQARFGQDVAVYAGDYLFSATFSTLANHTHDLETGRKATTYLEQILNGELMQRSHYYQLDLPIETYLEQISGKTAALFELAAQLGLSTNQDKTEADKALEPKAIAFAYNLGMAFQILDDLLDYRDDSETLGKPTLNDMREGIYSAPLIFAIQRSPQVKDILNHREKITDAESQKVADLVHTSGAFDEATELAVDYTDKALDLLDQFPEGQSKDILTDISERLLHRNV
ncbi:heptaprenyl diphosphate synthase [Weissella uvarum]|uniref:polyprenyl synthetase family protein n=1 Tax=Weissella uvarum TaxID=1479233 RepID=UPI001960FE36|nr:polyprenyl synthetase family protein [Weissella uvarum]MBM7616784.1 heptaprenyl diphosphate synthase [Weissella uvarum]MCM0594762.1 polyprenyl synthetase family protein [Weissella uvarum]